jgi:hypothetical protein
MYTFYGINVKDILLSLIFFFFWILLCKAVFILFKYKANIFKRIFQNNFFLKKKTSLYIPSDIFTIQLKIN